MSVGLYNNFSYSQYSRKNNLNFTNVKQNQKNFHDFVSFGSAEKENVEEIKDNVLKDPPHHPKLSGPRKSGFVCAIAGALMALSQFVPQKGIEYQINIDKTPEPNTVTEEINSETSDKFIHELTQPQEQTQETDIEAEEHQPLASSINYSNEDVQRAMECIFPNTSVKNEVNIPAQSQTEVKSVQQIKKQQVQQHQNLVMKTFDSTMKHYGFEKFEVKKDKVDIDVNWKTLLNSLGWTILATTAWSNYKQYRDFGKDTKQPSMWTSGVLSGINFPLVLFGCPMSFALSNVVLGMIVAGDANNVGNSHLKPGEKRREYEGDLKFIDKYLCNPKNWAEALTSKNVRHKLGHELIEVSKFVADDTKMVAITFRDFLKQTGQYTLGKRKDTPDLLKKLVSTTPDADQKKVTSMAFWTTGAASTLTLVMGGDLNSVLFESMGIAGFMDSVNVYAQAKEFDGKAKYGVCVAVAGKGLMDLLTGTLAGGAMGLSPEFWTGTKFITMGGALSEFWHKREGDAIKENWAREKIENFKKLKDQPVIAASLLEILKKKAKKNPDFAKVLKTINNQAKADKELAELLQKVKEQSRTAAESIKLLTSLEEQTITNS